MEVNVVEALMEASEALRRICYRENKGRICYGETNYSHKQNSG